MAAHLHGHRRNGTTTTNRCRARRQPPGRPTPARRCSPSTPSTSPAVSADPRRSTPRRRRQRPSTPAPTSLYIANADGTTARRSTASTSPAGASRSTSAPAPCPAACSTRTRCRSTTARCASSRRRTARRATHDVALYVLDADTLKATGHVGGLGPRRAGARRPLPRPARLRRHVQQVDPLYVLDLTIRHTPTGRRAEGDRVLRLPAPGRRRPAARRGRGRQRSSDRRRAAGLAVRRRDSRPPAAARERRPQPHARPRHRSTRTRSCTGRPAAPRSSRSTRGTRPSPAPRSSCTSARTRCTPSGTIRNPAVGTVDGYDTGIERSLVIGDDIWTMSARGCRSATCTRWPRQAWVPFSVTLGWVSCAARRRRRAAARRRPGRRRAELAGRQGHGGARRR